MAGTTLTIYVGLTVSDAERLFAEHLPLKPHYMHRWGLKPTVTEVPLANATVLSWCISIYYILSRSHEFISCMYVYIYIYILDIYLHIYIYIYVYTSILVSSAHLYIQSSSPHASSATFHCRWILARRSPAAFSPTSRNQRRKMCELTWWPSQRKVLRTLQWLDVIWKSFDVFVCRQLWACLADLRWVGNWNLWVMDGFGSMVS